MSYIMRYQHQYITDTVTVEGTTRTNSVRLMITQTQPKKLNLGPIRPELQLYDA